MKSTIAIKIVFIFCVLSMSAFGASVSEEFENPSKQYRPETWFHLIGNNITKEGISKDLQAIADAGFQGIHLFTKKGGAFPGVEQIKVLTPEWEDMIRHAANETSRLGLKLTLQNCPGWSMTGGPWVPASEAQRELVFSEIEIEGDAGSQYELPVSADYLAEDQDYQDIMVMAFPIPDFSERHVPRTYTSNNTSIPLAHILGNTSTIDWQSKTLSPELMAYKESGIAKVDDKDSWIQLDFETPVTVNALELPPIRDMVINREYPVVDARIEVLAKVGAEFQRVAELDLPDTNWQDRRYGLTLSVPPTKAQTWKMVFKGRHALFLSQLNFLSSGKLHNYEAKAARALRSLDLEIDSIVEANAIIKKGNVLDLTANLQPDGKLIWQAPQGIWKVVRVGHVNMRLTNKPAPPEATGWEASKMDKEAIENHLRKGMIGNLLRPGGPLAAKTPGGENKLDGLLIDSWESFIPNWTMLSDRYLQEFRQRRGYDMRPYMPVLMGHVVDSVDTSEAFLRDIRQTADDLFVDNFFTHFRTIAHEFGAQVYTEGASGEVLPGDALRYYGVSDIPMTEFWYPKSPSSQVVEAKIVYPAASATHLYDKPFLAAEACTQLGVQWNEHPYSVKSLIDFNFTKGINHLVFHTFTHTPQVEVFPGSTFGGHIGFPLVRNQTWWPHMREWLDYLARIQVVLQQGEHAADVLWYLGDDLARPPYDSAPFPSGYKFDYLNHDILQTRVGVKNGAIAVSGAGSYRLIKLRDSKRLLLSTLQKLETLVKNGAVIVGEKPQTSPSLADHWENLPHLRRLAKEMWGDGLRGMKRYGKGRVYWGYDVAEVLDAENIQPDVTLPDSLEVHWIHKETEDKSFYFLSSLHEQALDVSISFKAKGQPQFWDAFTGEVTDAQVWHRDGDNSHVALTFDPHGSVILVFDKQKSSRVGNKAPAWQEVKKGRNVLLSSSPGWFRLHNEKSSQAQVRFESGQLLAQKSGSYVKVKQSVKAKPGAQVKEKIKVKRQRLDKHWQASFVSGWDAPDHIMLRKLSPLNEHKHPGVRHYSGTVVYEKNFDYDELDGSIILDLGQVYNLASVNVNGRDVGARWAPPFLFDVSKFVKKGENTLTVTVTNTWRNQLIFDRTRDKEEKRTWTSNPPKEDNLALDPSGLVGPVELRTVQRL